jgi:hypothetical protein
VLQPSTTPPDRFSDLLLPALPHLARRKTNVVPDFIQIGPAVLPQGLPGLFVALAAVFQSLDVLSGIHTALAALHQLKALVIGLLGPVFVGLNKSLLLVLRGFGCCLDRAG